MDGSLNSSRTDNFAQVFPLKLEKSRYRGPWNCFLWNKSRSIQINLPVIEHCIEDFLNDMGIDSFNNEYSATHGLVLWNSPILPPKSQHYQLNFSPSLWVYISPSPYLIVYLAISWEHLAIKYLHIKHINGSVQKDFTPLITHWTYVFLLTHRYVIINTLGNFHTNACIV